MIDFTGKVVLLTGASSGLGATTAQAFAKLGAKVFGIGRNGDGLANTLQTVAENGGVMETCVVDIGDPLQCKNAVQACIDSFGQLDVLANIAGRHTFRHTTEVTPEQWAEDMAVNLNGPFFLAQAAIPHLLARDGNIVNVSSIAGMTGQPYSAAYCSAKHGLLGLTRSLAMEYMHAPLRVNCVVPGGMDTPQVQNIQFPDNVDFNLIMRAAAPRGYMSLEQVANVILFLASDAAKSVHGAIHVVDAGKTVG